MSGILFRSILGFSLSLIALLTYTIVLERKRRSPPPLWAGLILLLVMLIFRVSAFILSIYSFAALNGGWIGTSEKNLGLFIILLVGILGLWSAGILLQVLNNLVRFFLGMPMDRIDLLRKPARCHR